MRKYIEAGKIVNTHGVKGALKAESWCDTPKVLCGLKSVYFAPKNSGDGFTSKKVVSGSVQGERAILSLEGIASKEQAELLKGTVIYADRDEIPTDGGFLIDDLKGLPVIDDTTKAVLGKFVDVNEIAGRKLFEVNVGREENVLIPAVREFIKRIDVNEGIFVTPIKGLFDDED